MMTATERARKSLPKFTVLDLRENYLKREMFGVSILLVPATQCFADTPSDPLDRNVIIIRNDRFEISG